MSFSNNDNNFDVESYKKLNPDLAHFSFSNLTYHYKNYGKNEGRFCSEKQIKEFVEDEDFDVESYKNLNPDLANFSYRKLIYHYKYYGKKEGRFSSENQIKEFVEDQNFDVESYKKLNPDLPNFSYRDLIHHYKNYGKNECRFCSENQIKEFMEDEVLDIELYKKLNPDLPNFSYRDLIHHYKNYGKKEGRFCSENQIKEFVEDQNFDTESYKKLNPDLPNFSYRDLIHHYKNYGKNECRFCSENQIKEFMEDEVLDIELYKKLNPELSKLSFYEILRTLIKNHNLYKFRKICYENIEKIKKYTLPNFLENSTFESVLIEFRILPHLEFTIYNTIVKLGEKWSHTIICGNINYNFIVDICKRISNKIKIINIGLDNFDRNEYSLYLTKLDFWNLLVGEKILIYQEDTCIFRYNINDFIDWDYIGAPWLDMCLNNSKNVGNGGLSLRSKSIMKEIITKFSLKDTGERYIGHDNSSLLLEDVYFTKNMDDFKIGKLADKKTASLFSTETIINKESFGGHQFWLSDKKWKDRINDALNIDFSYALVFICHNLYSFNKIKKYLKFKNCFVIIVGNKIDSSFFDKNEKIFIAKNFNDNIENEKKLLTFTAWYLIAKNNLFLNFSHICLLEYDVILRDDYMLQQLDTFTKEYDIISFNGGNSDFHTDIVIDIKNEFLNLKNLNVDQFNSDNLFWYHSTNHCIKRTILVDFVDWYYPDCFNIKLKDYHKFSYYHERLFSVYILNYNYKIYLFRNSLTHMQNNSHENILNNTEKYFLTYNDNSKNYDKYTRELIDSVDNYSNFQTIIYNKNDIDYSFRQIFENILNQERGGGYWLWKPYIILSILNKLNFNDILFYLDSKYFFVENFENLFIDKLSKTDIVVWKNKPNEEITYLKNYCKMDVIKKYNMEDLVFNKSAESCWGGAIIIKKTTNSIKIIEEWLKMCCNEHDLTDSESISQNNSEFKDHRHDQSLLSIVLHKYNIPFYFFEKKYLQNIRYPW
jgi:hypothetical protein